MTLRIPGLFVAAGVMAALLALAACDSTVPPPPSGGAASNPPGSSGEPSPLGSFVASSAGPVYGPASLAPAMIPGLPPGSEVQLMGNEYLAEGYSAFDCTAFAGWLQAGDWIIDGTMKLPESSPGASPAPSPASSPDADTIPITIFSISRPGDAAVVRVGPAAEGGCGGIITRLSRQDVQASGELTAATQALSYPIGCAAGEAHEANLSTVYFGDDGTVAYVKGTMPLALGEQEITDVELRLGQSDRRPSNSLEMFLFASNDALDAWGSDLDTYSPGAGATAKATVTSIDPLIGTVALTGLQSSSGASESVTLGMRCDLLGNQLTALANYVAPSPTPGPTVAPGGHLEIQVGSIDEQVDGPEVACSFFDYGGGDTRWQLTYFNLAEEGALNVQLTVPATGEPFMTARKGDLSYAADGTGGSQLDATVDDAGSAVTFTADGKEFDGAAIHLQAQCGNVTR